MNLVVCSRARPSAVCRYARARVHRINANARRYHPPYEGAKVYPGYRKGGAAIAVFAKPERTQLEANSTTKDGIYCLLERIDMNNLDDRGHGRGRPPRRAIHGEAYGIVLVGAAGCSSPLAL
jgi:hypothetical protein